MASIAEVIDIQQRKKTCQHFLCPTKAPGRLALSPIHPKFQEMLTTAVSPIDSTVFASTMKYSGGMQTSGHRADNSDMCVYVSVFFTLPCGCIRSNHSFLPLRWGWREISQGDRAKRFSW